MKLDALTELIYASNIDAFLKATHAPVDLSGFDSRNSSVLHAAARVEGMSAVINRICERGIDVNLRDSDGVTPLMNAVNYRCPNNARTLIALGANVDLFDNEGVTALLIAAGGSDVTCATLLLDAGADVDSKASTRATPLHRAADDMKNLPMLELLLARGADINDANGGGTAIMSAVSYEKPELVRWFLDRGADIEKPKNRAGETTLEFAERVGNAEIVAMLREKLKAPTSRGPKAK